MVKNNSNNVFFTFLHVIAFPLIIFTWAEVMYVMKKESLSFLKSYFW